MRSRTLLRVAGVLCCVLLASLVFAEEFVGPFPSWKNVKAEYGAVGDGKADDTVAIQKAFNDLQKHEQSCVLYFPAGTYRITGMVKTLREAHTDCMGVAIVGEDPATTILKWDGEDGGTMVQYDAWYSKISRLTLDGAGKAGIGLAYGKAFSTYNETSDMVFQDMATGMQMGVADAGQAENAVLRCTFKRCANNGLATVNFNSLDIWLWYCRFEDCGYGIYNGAGNYHAYQNLFLRSKKADVGTANLMVFSFINNTSINSNCFMDFAGGHSWGSPTSVTGNRIIEPTGDWAIRLSNGGPYLVMDNIIKARPGVTKPLVEMTWGDQAFVGNTYTIENAVKENGKFRRVDEKVVDPKTIDVTPPTLPGTPVNYKRRIFEVPAGASAAAIQQVITAAGELKGKRPVVHLPKGTYKIDQTLVISAGCDVQLVGDGAAETATVLQWTGAAGGVLLKLTGPSRAMVRDLSLNAADGNAIRVDDCDQPGGKVFADQLNVSGTNQDLKSGSGLLVDGLENTDVQANCLQGATFCRTWVHVVGGPRAQKGEVVKNQINVYAGATGSADAQYNVSQGGKLVVRSVYHEMSGDSPQGILLNDTGSLTVDSTRFSYKTTPETPLIAAENFKGDFALLTGLLLPVNSTHTADVTIKGDNSKGNILCLGNVFWVNEVGVDADKVWHNQAQPAGNAAMLLCNMNSGTKDALKHGAFDHLDDRGTADDVFLRKMLTPLREARIWLPGDVAAGKTNLEFHRVIITTGNGGVGVDLHAGK